jgi:hypothetical protein
MIPRLALRRARGPSATPASTMFRGRRRKRKKRGRRTRDCEPMVIYTVLKERLSHKLRYALSLRVLAPKATPARFPPPPLHPRPHVFSTRQVPTSPVSCTLLGPVLPSVDKTLLGVGVERKLFDMGAFLSPKDPGAFKCCLSASWFAPTAKPSRELTSNPNLLSPPKFFSSFPLRQEAAGAVVKPLVWTLLSTSQRGHCVTEPSIRITFSTTVT